MTNLEPGEYQIEVSAPGFSTEVNSLTLRVGDHLTINFKLRPGSVEKKSRLEARPPPVQIKNLPLNGRNFLELARLEPGVSVVSEQIPVPLPTTIHYFN